MGGHTIEIGDPSAESLTRDIAPRLQKLLESVGVAIVRPTFLSDADPYVLEYYLAAFLINCGSFLGRRVSFLRIQNRADASTHLPIHTEGIYLRRGVIPAFGLGCINAASSGGTTIVYDAKRAARILIEEHPELSSVEIEYTSGSYTGEFYKRHLVELHPVYGKVLRFRSGMKSNKYMHCPEGMSASDVHDTVMGILDDCVICEHAWSQGEIMLVNNLFTLHGRSPYVGDRTMLRVRYDDFNNCKLYL